MQYCLDINRSNFNFYLYYFYGFQILQKLIQNDREENQGDTHHFLSGPSITVMIRRNYIYEDAFDKLSPENGLLFSVPYLSVVFYFL
jgi:ubiquitin-protein ligase E3 C